MADQHVEDLERRARPEPSPLKTALQATQRGLEGTGQELNRLDRAAQAISRTLDDLEAWPSRLEAAGVWDSPETLCVTFDPHGLKDPERAELIRTVVQQVDPSTWHVEAVNFDIQSLDAWIDHYYNLGGKYPLSHNALKEEVNRGNPKVDLGKKLFQNRLHMPPFPRIPNDDGGGSGVYDPKDSRYTHLRDAAGHCNKSGTSLLNRSATAPEYQEETFNNAVLTSIEVDLREGAEILKELGRLSTQIDIGSGKGQVRLDLHQDDESPVSPETWAWKQSPFYEAALAQTEDYRQRLLEALATSKESDTPAIGSDLWIIDWGFKQCRNEENQSQADHGAKVLAVARSLLTQLDLGVLGGTIQDDDEVRNLKRKERRRIPQLRILDLRPNTHNKGKLQRIVRSYQKWMGRGYSNRAQRAIDWIENQANKLENTNNHLPKCTQNPRVNEFLMNAVFHHVLYQADAQGTRPVILNLSLGVPSSAHRTRLLQILNQAKIDRKKVVVLSSAGNLENNPIHNELSPQGLAALASTDVFNVTHNNRAGKVLGNETLSTEVPVLTTTLGCSQSFGGLKPEDCGSSFASPAVATALWIRQLIRNDGNLGESRLAILKASVPPGAITKTEAGGYFEPLLAIAGLGNHALTSDKKVIELEGCSVSFRYVARGVESVPTHVGPGHQGQAVKIGRGYGCRSDDGTECLWWQRLYSGSPDQGGSLIPETSALQISAQPKDKTKPTIDLDRFLDHYDYLYCEY